MATCGVCASRCRRNNVTSEPNSQNWPKKAEGFMTEIFGEGNVPPLIRTIVKPPEHWFMLESDYQTAELCVLANLSNDPNMMKAIYTPGMDLHDKSAVDGFGFRIEHDGVLITLDDIVAKATAVGDKSDEFDAFMKSLVYIDQQGRRYTRSEFKSGPRVAAKAISFSVPYGIAAKSLGMQIKAQTGDKRDIQDIVREVDGLITKWKTVSYPVAWDTLVGWQQRVYDPGYVENPWGRRKWANIRGTDSRPDIERQFGNAPIQSTVSDTVQIAMDRLIRRREDEGLRFRLQNQIHDAIMLEVPEDEVEQAKAAIRWAMSEIDIPTFDAGRTFRLGCDIDLYERWGVKMH